MNISQDEFPTVDLREQPNGLVAGNWSITTLFEAALFHRNPRPIYAKVPWEKQGLGIEPVRGYADLYEIKVLTSNGQWHAFRGTEADIGRWTELAEKDYGGIQPSENQSPP